MHRIDRHGDGLIPKYDFINQFKETNVIPSLTTELIEKIVDLYLNNDKAIIMVHYPNLINALCEDIKKLVKVEYQNFPIEKYKDTIPKNNKRAQSAYAYDRKTGNLNHKSMSNVKNYQNKINPNNERQIKNDLGACKRIFYLFNNNKQKKKMISYLELMNILSSHHIYINKLQILKMLKFLNILNPNAFTLQEFINKTNNYFKTNTNNFRSQQNNFANDNGPFDYDKFNKDYEFNNRYLNFCIKAIKILKERIKQMDKNPEEYFDHLLSYNICRKANLIYPDEFIRLMKLEKLFWNDDEINALFHYFDFKRDNIMERREFVKTLTEIPYPITTLQNFIKNNRLSIEEICYRMKIDLFNNNNSKNELERKVDRNEFRNMMNGLNQDFNNNFVWALFNAISKKSDNSFADNSEFYLPIKNIIDVMNIYNKKNFTSMSSKDISQNVIQTLQNSINSSDLL